MLGERLRELRMKHAMTQEALGKKVNTKKAAISKYENNKIEPNIEMLLKFAEIFNVSVDYLVGNTFNRQGVEVEQEQNIEINQQLDALIKHLELDKDLMFYGESMDQNLRNLLLKSIKNVKELAEDMKKSN